MMLNAMSVVVVVRSKQVEIYDHSTMTIFRPLDSICSVKPSLTNAVFLGQFSYCTVSATFQEMSSHEIILCMDSNSGMYECTNVRMYECKRRITTKKGGIKFQDFQSFKVAKHVIQYTEEISLMGV
jgi:hypothetical protein